MSSDRFYECTRDAMDAFEQYDRNADIVTSWESLARPFRSHFPDFNFDRFPSCFTNNERWANPNFSTLFDQRYGIVFQAYHRSSISKTPSLFERELDKLRKIDSEFEFSNRDGRLVEPKTVDIALLVDSGDSQTFSHKVAEAINSGELDLNAQIIVLEYDYVQNDGSSLYRYKRLGTPDNNFRDDILPEAGSFSHRLSMEGGTFEHIRVKTDEEFAELKSTGMFTNRGISELYLACRLWDTVLHKKLSDDDRQVWKKEDPKKKIPMVVSCSDIAADLNQRFAPGANFVAEDVKEALQFIAVAKRAVQVGDDEFRVQYSNLIEKRREHKDSAAGRSDVRDLAFLLSSWYCETKVESSMKEIADIVTSDSYNKADLSNLSGDEVINL